MGCGASSDLEDPNNAGAPAAQGGDDDYDSDDDDRFDLYTRNANGAVNEDGKLLAEDPDAADYVHSALNTRVTPPWAGSIVAPTNAPDNDPSPPDQNLELEWVYGYRCDDSYNNLGVDSKGRIVYPAAAVIVAYDSKSHSQTLNQKHEDDILCFSSCEGNPDLFATGQQSTINKIAGTRRSVDPKTVIWNTATNESVVIESSNKKATRCVSLSRDGKYVACVGYDQPGTVNIFDAATGSKLASEEGDQLPNKINTLIWGPPESNMFVTIGVKHVFTWEFNGSTLEKKRAQMGGYDIQSFYTGCFLDATSTDFAVGAKSGEAYLFKRQDDGNYKTFGKKKAHKRTLLAMLRTDAGIYTAGKDKLVKCWANFDGDATSEIPVSSYARSLAKGPNGIVAGLREGKIVSLEGQAETTLVDCHWDGELWSLDVDTKNPDQFTTAGEDNTIFTWNKSTHKVVRRGEFSTARGIRRRRTRASTTSAHGVNHCARSITYSPDSSHLALGTNDGKITILNAADFSQVKVVDLNMYTKNKVRGKKDQWIQCMKYSPDGKTLAVGTHGSVIVLINVADDYSCGGKLDAHNSPLTNLDWAADSSAIQSNCMAYELLFHNVDQDDLKNSKQNPNSSELKDVKWHTQTCKMGWPVVGIWEEGMDGSDINNVDRSPDEKLIASADDWGRVNLYRNPVGEHNEKKSFDNGHSSHVVCCRFTPDGKHLISVGGNDKCVLQWKVC
jgi:WD40 repeat protein